MPTAIYVQTPDLIDYTPGSAVTAGDVIVQSDLVAIAPLDIAASALGSLAVQGVWDMPCDAAGTGTAIAAGDKLYWDAINEIVSLSSGVGKYCGKAVSAVAATGTTCRVMLNQPE